MATGIGTGFLIVPRLMLATGMPLACAAASSPVSVFLYGATTSLNFAVSGLVDWPIVGLFVVRGVVGGLVGLRGAKALAVRAALARPLFAGLILAVAAYFGWRPVNG